MRAQVDREKAIEAAMAQIERQFGKGSIMKLGSKVVLDGHWTRRWVLGDFPGAGSVKFSVRKHPAKQPLRFTRLPGLRIKTVLQLLSTLSMP
jgi:hypothetical protein